MDRVGTATGESSSALRRSPCVMPPGSRAPWPRRSSGTSRVDRDARDATIRKLADDLVTVLGGMRGAAMKLGQLLAVIDIGIASPSARDGFSARLQPLFQSAPRWTEAAMMSLLEQQLGPVRARIVHLEGPIAAASIGQVYKGTLDDGRIVAVKIQYPRIDAMVRADLKTCEC